MKQYMALLGKKCKDRVTLIEGVITSVSFDLYGCVQCVMDRGFDKDGKRHDLHYFDWARMVVVDETPVMPVPTFDDDPIERRAAPSTPSSKTDGLAAKPPPRA